MTKNPFLTEAGKSRYSRSRCKFCKAVKSLDDEKKVMFVEAMLGDTTHTHEPISTRQIQVVLRDEWDFPYHSVGVIHEHRVIEDSTRSKYCLDQIKSGWGLYE